MTASQSERYSEVREQSETMAPALVVASVAWLIILIAGYFGLPDIDSRSSSGASAPPAVRWAQKESSKTFEARRRQHVERRLRHAEAAASMRESAPGRVSSARQPPR